MLIVGIFRTMKNPTFIHILNISVGNPAVIITHIHVTVINSGHATLLSTAHTVGLHCADCGYNPAWCRSHLLSPKWPKMCRVGR